jgi:hypothetical protein
MSKEYREKLCGMKKDVEGRLDEWAALVHEPRNICTKCARVANRSEWLCCPVQLPAPSADEPG